MNDQRPAYDGWTGTARASALAIDAAVAACIAHDAEAFDAALIELGRADGEQRAVLLATVTQDLIERAHPDGIDADDAERLLQGCIRLAAGWYTALDTDVLIRALTGALGVATPDDAAMMSLPLVVAHGVVLIAELLTTLRQQLAPVLDGALRELMRAQTIELP